MVDDNRSVFLADTHCHLDFNIFDNDREEVIERARSAGVVRILNPGIDLESSRKSIEISEAYPSVYAAVGVHPNDSMDWQADTVIQLWELAQHPKVVAIGEIGLDYYRDKSPREHQRRVFIEQLELAAQMNLPVVIHNRQATGDLLPIIDNWHAQLHKEKKPLADHPGILHSFSDTSENAREAIQQNFMIGITGPVTFSNAPGLRKVVADIPIECLLIETDSPFLTPHPNRGKRNEPAFVRLVAEKLSELFSIPLEEIGSITTDNAKKIFKW